MLDMSVRAKILELMLELKDELDLTYVYITHDLATAKFFCDRIAIMYLGRIVELGPAEADLRRPQAPVHAVAAAGDPRARPAPQRPARPAARRDPRRGLAAARLLASTPAARRRSRSAAGRAATCGRCSRPAGRSCRRTEYEAERELIGDLDALDQAVVRDACCPLRGGHAGENAEQVLEAMRADAPDDPLWKGVAETEVVEPRGRGRASTRASSRAGSTSTGSRSSATCTTPRRSPARRRSARRSSGPS